MLGVQVWMLGLGCALKGRGENKSTREEGAVGKLVGRQQPSSCKIREIKAIMGAKTRSLRSRFELGGGGSCPVRSCWGGRVDGVGFGGRQAISRFQWPGGWTGWTGSCDGVARMEGQLWMDGWTIARFVEKT
jgi:hypothetical protein